MNKDNKLEIVKFVYGDTELNITICPYDETIWLTIKEMSILYNIDKSGISRHIKNIYKKEELDLQSTCAKYAHMADSSPRKYAVNIYNLDIVIMVGYRVNPKMASIFRKWVYDIFKSYVVKEKRVVVSNDNYIELKNEVISINKKIQEIENNMLCNKCCVDNLFYKGEFFDAYTLIQSIFESAKFEIIIVDNYLDRTVLDRLIVKNENVKVILCTSSKKARINQNDVLMFNKQYGSLSIRYTKKVHDRYIIIDRVKFYHLGHSIKDLGKKVFSIIESDDNLIEGFLKSINIM